MSPLAHLLRLLIRIYQLSLRAVIGPHCRYEPSCSHYARDAIRLHGALGGSRLAAGRVLRCHPWAEGGYDPVPDPHPGSCDCRGSPRLRTKS